MSFWSSLSSTAGSVVRSALGVRSPDMPLPKMPLLNGSVMGDEPLYKQVARIGGSLTPAQVTGILREADSGRTKRLMDLGNASKQKDGHLQAILETAEHSISGMKWQLTLDEEKPTKRDQKRVRQLERVLRGVPSFSRMLAHQAGSIYYSYSVTETKWTLADGMIVPRCFDPVQHRRFEFRQSDGRLVWAEDGQPQVDFQSEHPGQFIVSQPRVNGDAPHREGLIRVLVWAALFRNWTLTDWLRLGETAWKPYVIGTYQKANYVAQESVDSLIATIGQMYSSGRVVIPDDVELEVNFPGSPGSGAPTHQALFETMAREMSKAVLSQTETVQASASSGYAQAKVGDDIRRELRNARAVQIGAHVTSGVVEPLVHWNYGPSFPRVRFEFITQEPRDLKTFSEGVTNLVKAGVRIGQKWVRDEAGIPEPEEGEELCEVEAPEMPEADGESHDEPGGETPPTDTPPKDNADAPPAKAA